LKFASIWYRFHSPHRNRALPLNGLCIYRCASTHFEEIQLAPSSTGISPLTTTHPLIFQHQSVRTSIWCHPSFILAMVRSLGFGSIKNDFMPYSDLLSLWLRVDPLTLPFLISRRLILQQARGHLCSHRLSAVGFICFIINFTFPSRYSSLSVIQEYLVLRGGPRMFTQNFTCPMLLTNAHKLKAYNFKLRDFHPLWFSIQLIRFILSMGIC